MEDSQDPLYVEDDIPLRDETARRCRAEAVTGHTQSISANVASPGRYRSHFLAYDRNGNRIRQEKFDTDGNTIQRWVYDDAGRVNQEIVYNRSGSLDYRFDFVYDGAIWIEKRMYDAQSQMHYRVVRKLASNGGVLDAIFYDASDGIIRSDSYSYNNMGLVVRVDIRQSGTREFRYDDQNNLIERSTSLPGASVYGNIDEFRYDDRGLLDMKHHLHESITSFDWHFFE